MNDEQNRNFQVWFSILLMASGTFGVDIHVTLE